MADSSVTFQPTAATPPTGTVISTRTNAAAEHMQVVLLGIDGSDSVVAPDAVLGLPVSVTQEAADSVTTGTITAAAQNVTASVAPGMQGVGLAYFGTYATGATLTWEVSADGGTTYTAFVMQTPTGLLGHVTVIAAVSNSQSFYEGALPVGATHVRVRCTAWAAPTGTINIRLVQTAAPRVQAPNLISNVSAAGVTSVVPGVAATNLGKAEDAAAVTGDTGVAVLGVRNDAQATSTSGDGDYSQVSVDPRGAVRVNSASFTYSHISTSTTTTVKPGAGELHAISVNTKGTVASTITVFDNTAGSGAVIGVIDSLNLSGAFVLDVAFTTGLTIVTTGTVAPDLTVSYR